MFLVFTLVLLVVISGILINVYSIFFPFMQNLGNVSQYHMAYYGAVSAVERAELGLKYRTPGFVGSGGFLGTTLYGPASDYTPELLSGTQQGFWWMIDSRTTSIPRAGMGNTDPMLSASDSKNYNALGYIYLEKFLLQYDNTTGPNNYYTGTINLTFFSGATITGVFRLPPKILSGFGGAPNGLLCNDSSISDCDIDNDTVYDDSSLSWVLEGLYKGTSFTIYPRVGLINYNGQQIINGDLDNFIRESIINESGNIIFANGFTPVSNGSYLTGHNVQNPNIQDKTFSAIFGSSDFSGLSLSFGAVNDFWTRLGNIYPYIEYQFNFPQPIADRFYTIEGHGRVGEYNVQIIIKKPTTQETAAGNYTMIF